MSKITDLTQVRKDKYMATKPFVFANTPKQDVVTCPHCLVSVNRVGWKYKSFVCLSYGSHLSMNGMSLDDAEAPKV